MYNVKGAGKLDKIGACNVMIKELLRIHDDCLQMLTIVQNCENAFPHMFQLLNVTPVEDELNPMLNKLNAKIKKEKEFQQKIIENKDFDALVKDVNKTIRARNLFTKVMIASIEQLTKNVTAKNINEKYQTLIAYEQYLNDTASILENQIKFASEQSDEAFRDSLKNYEESER